MRRWIVVIVAVLQIGVLAYMAGEREWILRTGEPVFVRTAPIDPRDPMRGDYVRLEYEVSTVPRALCAEGLQDMFTEANRYRRVHRDRRVYAVLTRGEGGVAGIEALTDREPAGGLYMRGRIQSVDVDSVNVRYGIEALFTEQGAARRFEDEVRGAKAGVPVNAQVALSRRGVAVLSGYRWEPLGITCVLRRAEQPADPARRDVRGVIGATVTLKNHSDAPVAIVDLPGAGSFRLVAVNRWAGETHVPVSRRTPGMPQAADVVLLQPGQSHEVELDFTTPDWFVQAVAREGAPAEPPQALEALAGQWSAWFRIEYLPPPAAACAGLPHAEAIRHAPLRTRSFGAAGGID